MTRAETKQIVDKIQVYRQSFLITNNVYQEWFRVLESYDYEDVDKKLDDFNMTFVFYDKNDKEVYRFTDQNPEVNPGEKVMLRAETMTYLGDVVRFEIIDA